jgi:hypothetical protein
MTTNNCDTNKFIASESETWAHVRVSPKPIVKVRNRVNSNANPNSNYNSKAEADHNYDLILSAIARLNGNITNLEELISKMLAQQHYAAIRERERRW